MVICLERGADLHMAQLMPLPLTVSCSSKTQIGFTFLVPAHLGIVPDKGPLYGVCVFRARVKTASRIVSYRIVAAGRGTTVSTTRPHGTHHISATDGARFLVCMPLHLLDTPANCAETDKQIEMSFRIQANVDPVNHVLVGGCTSAPPDEYN